jgi:hypothetical protein
MSKGPEAQPRGKVADALDTLDNLSIGAGVVMAALGGSAIFAALLIGNGMVGKGVINPTVNRFLGGARKTNIRK